MKFKKNRKTEDVHSGQMPPPESHSPEHHQSESLFKGIMLAHLILAFHVVLLAGVGVVVLFFRGVTSYMLWIFLFFMAAFVLSGYWLYRRARREGRNLKDALRSPVFNGRAVEVSILGGLASFRLGREQTTGQLEDFSGRPYPQLEDSAGVRLREIKELAHLLETNLITQEEYNRIKQQLFDSQHLS